jgi:5-methyltetrahydropteroyltriglutamate--homocysteine methyltransferase
MKTGIDRILTTHVGSLPRVPVLLGMLGDLEAGRTVSPTAFQAEVSRGLRDIISQQASAGVDIAGDGELPRIGFSMYVKDRMSGFGGSASRGTVTDFAKFPGYAALMAKRMGMDPSKSASVVPTPECVAAVHYDPKLARATEELDLFAAALATEKASAAKLTETFVTAASPGIISTTLLRNAGHPVYRSDTDYVFAIADEMKKEYEAIVARGHVLQLDAPDLALERQIMYADKPLREFLARVELHIEAINRAVRDIPKDRVRLHVCWGNWDGPHCDDVDLEPLLPILYRARVGGLSLACANPRHHHEVEVFRRLPPPKDLVILPGVIDVTTNMVEHPQLVANRLLEFVDIVGDRERVIANTDCGFSTFAGYTMVAGDVVWEKLRTLTQGAKIASGKLWGNSRRGTS